MPRIYDFNSKPSPEEDGLFVRFPEERHGTGEVSSTVFHKDPWRPAHGQFVYDTTPPLEHYRNETLDPAFEWLEQNVLGGWYWMERECNHGRSVDVTVWFGDRMEADRFAAQWRDRFLMRMWAIESNLERKLAAEATAKQAVTPTASA